MSTRNDDAQRAGGAHAAEAPSLPRPFGSYILLEHFARGGMGEVYLAKSGGIIGLERYCVLKKLRADLTRDQEYRTRFIDEARVVVHLNHANICHVFEVGLVDGEYFLAMEYISGRDLRTVQDRARTRGVRLAPEMALFLLCEVLEALDYAHRTRHPATGELLQLVHRDVSPQNVLVSYEGEVKLIDFGLAASRLKVERTQPKVVMGKMAYMAPEQARGDVIDHRADLFACGVLAYELLAGERYYEGMSANEIWHVAGSGGFTPRAWGSLDPVVAKHVARALHPEPKKRFATCSDFREALADRLFRLHPGAGVRLVRDTMNELFAEDLRKEREMLARFGTVSVAGFLASLEATTSQSVSLARSDDRIAATRLAASSEGASSGPRGQMPYPAAPLLGGRDLHQEETRLTPSGAVDAAPELERTTLAQFRPPVADDTDPAIQPGIEDSDTSPGTRSDPHADPTVRRPAQALTDRTERVERRPKQQDTKRRAVESRLRSRRRRRALRRWTPIVGGVVAASALLLVGRLDLLDREIPSVSPTAIEQRSPGPAPRASALPAGTELQSEIAVSALAKTAPVAGPGIAEAGLPADPSIRTSKPQSLTAVPEQTVQKSRSDDAPPIAGTAAAASTIRRDPQGRQAEQPKLEEPPAPVLVTPTPFEEVRPSPRQWTPEMLRTLAEQVQCNPKCALIAAGRGVTAGNAEAAERCIKERCR